MIYEFLEAKDERKKSMLQNLLWNASIKDKKIANFSLKMPFHTMANIGKNSDFNKLLRDMDSNHD